MIYNENSFQVIFGITLSKQDYLKQNGKFFLHRSLTMFIKFYKHLIDLLQVSAP